MIVARYFNTPVRDFVRDEMERLSTPHRRTIYKRIRDGKYPNLRWVRTSKKESHVTGEVTE